MPNYTKSGKILIPLTPEQFHEGIEEGHFCREKHKAFAALLYHTGLRVTEVLRARKEQFSLQDDKIYFDVGKRLKRGIKTASLMIPLDKPSASLIWDAIEDTKPKKRVFPYCRKTGYNIIARVWSYPHHFRLTKITNLLTPRKNERGVTIPGFSIPQLKSWTGLTLGALNFYVGMVDIEEMGKA